VSIHGKASHLIYGDHDVSAQMQKLSSSHTIDMAETTGFQVNDKTYVIGQNDDAVQLDGRYEGVLASAEQYWYADMTAKTLPLIALGYGMPIKAGSPVEFGICTTPSVTVTSPIGGIVTISGTLKASGGMFDGVYLSGATDLAATTTGATVDMGAAATNYGHAFLSIEKNNTGAAVVCKVQQSADGTTWSDLHVFNSVANGAGDAELWTTVGATQRYVRSVVTITGSSGTVRAFIGFGHS
jgi:hypothetical protein